MTATTAPNNLIPPATSAADEPRVLYTPPAKLKLTISHSNYPTPIHNCRAPLTHEHAHIHTRGDKFQRIQAMKTSIHVTVRDASLRGGGASGGKRKMATHTHRHSHKSERESREQTPRN